MGKTADVHQSIWSDPWYVDLRPDGKLLYLWAITTQHGNLAGLFTVSRRHIEFETGLSPARFDQALRDVHPKVLYHEDTGSLWVVGRAKRVRSKTPQIAKSVAKAVAEIEYPILRDEFLRKYADDKWLREDLAGLARTAGTGEPREGSPDLQVVPGPEARAPRGGQYDNEWPVWLEHYRETTGRESVRGSAAARKLFNGRRSDGRPLDELKLATVGAHSDEFLRSRKLDRPETILADSNIERYIELGREASKPKRRPRLPGERKAA